MTAEVAALSMLPVPSETPVERLPNPTMVPVLMSEPLAEN